jgi:hypothetical protein
MLITKVRESEKPAEEESFEQGLAFYFLKDSVIEEIVELWNTDENSNSLVLKALENALSVQGVQIGHLGSRGERDDKVHQQSQDMI